MGLSQYLSSVVCIWLASWAFRRKYETDYPLDRTGKELRWFVVLGGLTLPLLLKGRNLGMLRLAAGTIGMAFLGWPNFSYHIVQRFRRNNKEGQLS